MIEMTVQCSCCSCYDRQQTQDLEHEGAAAGKMQCASLTAAAEVGIALESEAVASAVREAEFERMQREAAEAGIASLHDDLEKLKQKLRSSQVSQSVSHCHPCAAAQLELWPETL